jgi:dTDP-4-amino-4,6-dideoxygalactose transaminase
MFSFHATKLFHSIEGGMLTFRDSSLKETFDYLKNFGFKNEVEVVMPGTNAKMNEMQALMGILVLRHLDGLIESSRKINSIYRECLKDVPGIKFPPPLPVDVKYNFIYQPIEVDEEQFGMSRDALYEVLKKYNIYSRRYYYPLLCDFPCYRSIAFKDPLLTARRVSERILCLPIYADLALEDVVRICEFITFLQSQSKLDEVSVSVR